MKFTNYYYKAFMLTSLQIPLLFSWHLKKKFPCQAQTDNCTTNILASNIFLYYNYNCFNMKYIVLFHKPLSAFIGTYEVILPLCDKNKNNEDSTIRHHLHSENWKKIASKMYVWND